MREREAIVNTGDLFRGSSHLFYVPAFTAMKDFHYNDPARSLGTATLTMSSLNNSWIRKSLTCPARTTHANPQARQGRNLYNPNGWSTCDHKNKLSQQGSL